MWCSMVWCGVVQRVRIRYNIKRFKFCDLYSVSVQIPFHLSLPHELSSSYVVRSTLSKIINKHTEHWNIFQGTAYTALRDRKHMKITLCVRYKFWILPYTVLKKLIVSYLMRFKNVWWAINSKKMVWSVARKIIYGTVVYWPHDWKINEMTWHVISSYHIL